MNSFAKYLESKKSVDDRALNQQVWNAMAEQMPNVKSIIEIGGGTGTMYQRLLDANLIKDQKYILIDQGAELVAIANQSFENHNFKAVHSDLFDFINNNEEKFDLIIAHAVLDLFDLSVSLPTILSLLKPGGNFYFTLNFDGESIFEPIINEDLDFKIMKHYHQSMDDRIINGKVSGDSKSGRHLFKLLTANHAKSTAIGASDWVVFSQDHQYPNKEAFFLIFILDTIFNELENHPEIPLPELTSWYNQRLQQVDDGSLLYIAHQLDYFGKFSG
jgi:SAM-dependent methyltransferase